MLFWITTSKARNLHLSQLLNYKLFTLTKFSHCSSTDFLQVTKSQIWQRPPLYEQWQASASDAVLMQWHSNPIPTHPNQDTMSTRPPQSFIDVCPKSIKMISGVHTPFGSSILWCLLKEYRRHTVQWASRAHVICQANLLQSYIDFSLFFADSL